MPTEKGLIISSREVRLKAHVDSKEFEKWINEYWNLEWQDLIHGLQSYIANGNHGNGEIYVLTFSYSIPKEKEILVFQIQVKT